MVATRCFTYNHAPYIEDALRGFAMQETTFPVVTIIVDDASTDGEQEVIRSYLSEHFQSPYRTEETEYANIICARHKTNANCDFVVLLLRYNHYSIKKPKMPYLSEWLDNARYQALCEGDDYWIEPKKLQMQVEYMENHQDYGMVHTDFDLSHGHRNHVKAKSDDDGIWFPRILTEGMGVGTCTVMLRKSVYDRTPKLYLGQGWLMGDYPMWIEMAHEAKVKYIPVVTTKYRVLDESASHSTDIQKLIEFKKNGVEIWQFYCHYYQIETNTDTFGPAFYESIVRFACRLGKKEIATEYYNKARVEHKVSRNCLLFYLASKYPIVKCIVQLYIKI